MKIRILLLACFFITIRMYGQVTFQKTYGDVEKDLARTIVHTMDGGYCMAGGTGPDQPDSTDIAIYRVNAYGDLVWSTRLSEIKDVFINDMIQTSAGDYILVGTTFASPIDPGHSDILVINVDDAGFFIWGFVYGGADFDEANAVVPTNGGYVILGNTLSYGSATKSALAMKIDVNGNPLWTTVSSSADASFFLSGDSTLDGGIIAAGGTQPVSGGTDFDHYVTKFDTSGNIVWCKRFSGAGAEKTYGVTATSDGGYLLGGVSTSNTAGNADASVLKLDGSGNLTWSYNYGTAEYDRASAVLEAANGNYMVAGLSNVGDSNNVLNHILLQEIDPSGNLQWSHTYGGFLGTCEGYSMARANDGYAVCGFTVGFSDPLGDVYLVKTDLAGWSGCFDANTNLVRTAATLTDSAGAAETQVTIDFFPVIFNAITYISQFGQNCFSDGIESLNSNDMLSLFPNPAMNELHVNFGNRELSGSVEILDATGRTIFQQQISREQRVNIPVGSFSPGLYLLRVQSGEDVQVRNFIRQ